MYIYDIECYHNYFLVCTISLKTGARYMWERYNDRVTGELFLPLDTYVGFNNLNYDWPMLSLAAAGATNAELKVLNDEIILGGRKHWQHDHELLYGLDQVDIIEVLPGVASLKIYGGRIGFPKLQDLPLDPSQRIVDDHISPMRQYCFNDCEVTRALHDKVRQQIDLRTRLGDAYEVDLRSKSDAQIAEAVITNQYRLLTGERVERPSSTALIGTAYRYDAPPWMAFDTTTMQGVFAEVLDTNFVVNDKGKINLPKSLTGKSIALHGRRYKMGIGGLHSMDKAATFNTDDDHVIFDIDVTSYYPSIILNNGYAPTQMGFAFLDIYRDLVERRLNAKATGDKTTADSLKITINGSFGKFGSRYSRLYAPDLMFHVTLTGQLALLMLIERLPGAVISANTDGITLRFPRAKLERAREWVTWWEQTTGFNMEWTEYQSYHRLDVNNYLAIKPDGSTKRKGQFTPPGLMKNPVNEIVIKAVIDNLLHGASTYETVHACNDIGMFVQLRTVRGGALKDGQPFGKSVRWYRSTVSTSNIYYASNGNKVGGTEHSRIVQDLPDSIPPDLDREWYVHEANEVLSKLCKSLNP